jgi:hypothetical protein
MLRTHYIDSRFINIQKIEDIIDYMYYKTTKKIRRSYKKNVHNRNLLIGSTSKLSEKETQFLRDLEFVFIPEENDTVDQLSCPEFMKIFSGWVMNVLEHIRYKTVENNCQNDIIRASFQLVFKYAIDYEGSIDIRLPDEHDIDMSTDSISQVLDINSGFLDLQLCIFKDNHWKVID